MNEVVSLGCGRGGHGVIRRLVDRGVRAIALLDDDRVKRVNLRHLGISDSWIGNPKAQELAAWASERGAQVRWAETKFSFELLEPWHPCADMIYQQSLFLALTDNHESQLQVAIAGARLDIPVIAARVYANGGGDVVAQLDVDRDPCMACFSAFQRRNNAPAMPLRGRDLPVGAGESVDNATADAAMAILGDLPARRRMFSPVPGHGTPTAWEIPADPRAEPIPIFFSRDPQCPICGDAARRSRRVASPSPSTPSQPSTAGMVGSSGGALIALCAAVALLGAPLGIMALWAPFFNRNQHNILVDLVGLAIGCGCLALLGGGIIAIGAVLLTLGRSLFDRA